MIKLKNMLTQEGLLKLFHLILQTFGIALSLSDAILGLTFLAWGNSLGGEYRLSQAVSHARSAIPLFF